MAAISINSYNNIAKLISGYTQQARTDAALITSSGIISNDARVSDAGEGFTGTLRWIDYAGAPQTSSVIEGDNSTADMTLSNKMARYVKSARNITASELSIQRLISKQDALSYLGQHFGVLRARDEDKQLRQLMQVFGEKLKNTETAYTANADAGIVGPSNKQWAFQTAYTHSDTSFAPLFEDGTTTFGNTTSANTLLDAVSMIDKDQEAPFYYLFVDSATYNVLRKNNRLDSDRITDGNISVPTLFAGKFRIVVSENANLAEGQVAGVTSQVAPKTSYVVKPGAFHLSDIAQVNPTAVERDEKAGNSTGAVRIFSRWGNIMHPKGLSWSKDSGTDSMVNFPNFDTTEGSAGVYGMFSAANWDLNADNVNELGVMPIFHG